MLIYKVNHIITLIILMFSFFLSAHTGNEKYGQIKGKIYDKEWGTTLPGVNITILNSNRMILSDIDGEYTIDSLKTGYYRIKVSYIGYKDFISDSIFITENNSKTVNIYLEYKTLEVKERDCYSKCIDSTSLISKNYYQKAFSVQDISKISDRYRLFVFPTYYSEFLIDIEKNDPKYGITLYIVDSTDLNIHRDLFNFEKTFEESKSININFFASVLGEYKPSVKINKYFTRDMHLYNETISYFQNFGVDTMLCIEHCNIIITDGTSILFETNKQQMVNRFSFKVSEYEDVRYNWISDLVFRIKNLLIKKN